MAGRGNGLMRCGGGGNRIAGFAGLGACSSAKMIPARLAAKGIAAFLDGANLQKTKQSHLNPLTASPFGSIIGRYILTLSCQ